MYGAELKIYNDVDNSEEETERTDFSLWAPPCYLKVTEFEKVGQVHNLPQNKVAIDLYLGLRHHGDKACKAQEAVVEIKNAE
jgi:hypothetical protein